MRYGTDITILTVLYTRTYESLWIPLNYHVTFYPCNTANAWAAASLEYADWWGDHRRDPHQKSADIHRSRQSERVRGRVAPTVLCPHIQTSAKYAHHAYSDTHGECADVPLPSRH